jgi:stage III sporulation protein SpoIIIAA
LIEIVLDLGRRPLARFPPGEIELGMWEVDDTTIDMVVEAVGEFSDDNRAGIARTLHRISAIRNRSGKIVGLTCRRGRAIYGRVEIIRDLVESSKSILLLGKPGIGKTTMLREVARVVAEDLGKRVIVVDTSNEIAGDGDIPHQGIGRSRRMQVASPHLQHRVMIEAVENHMPEIVIIDEIGTELEAAAARTIAERGVQLVGTAHGNTLDNLLSNPTLCDLVGGVESVTLGDDEARRRGTQKSILERRAAPSFDVLVEIKDRDRIVVHRDVAASVDSLLRQESFMTEVRIERDGEIETDLEYSDVEGSEMLTSLSPPVLPERYPGPMRIYPFGVNRKRLGHALKSLHLDAEIVDAIDNVDVLLTLRSYYRKRPAQLRVAEELNVPVYVLRNNSVAQLQACLANVFEMHIAAPPSDPIAEAEAAARQVLNTLDPVELTPADSFTRRLQHQIAERYNLKSYSLGSGPGRRVNVSKRRSSSGR